MTHLRRALLNVLKWALISIGGLSAAIGYLVLWASYTRRLSLLLSLALLEAPVAVIALYFLGRYLWQEHEKDKEIGTKRLSQEVFDFSSPEAPLQPSPAKRAG